MLHYDFLGHMTFYGTTTVHKICQNKFAIFYSLTQIQRFMYYSYSSVSCLYIAQLSSNTVSKCCFVSWILLLHTQIWWNRQKCQFLDAKLSWQSFSNRFDDISTLLSSRRSFATSCIYSLKIDNYTKKFRHSEQKIKLFFFWVAETALLHYLYIQSMYTQIYITHPHTPTENCQNGWLIFANKWKESFVSSEKFRLIKVLSGKVHVNSTEITFIRIKNSLYAFLLQVINNGVGIFGCIMHTSVYKI
jgi:hypothetical protein